MNFWQRLDIDLLPTWWRQRFLLTELLLCGVATAAIGVWVYRLGGDSVVDSWLIDRRQDLYTVLASVFGALLGFAITTVSIVLVAAQSDRMAALRDSKRYPQLWRTFFSAIWWLAFATVAAIVALLGDRDKAPVHMWFIILTGASFVVAVRLARVVVILERIVRLP